METNNELIEKDYDDNEITYEEYPSGDCFTSAYRNVIINKQYKLVHGIVTNAYGKRYIHAWCEYENKAYDTTSNMVVPVKIYYEVGRIEYTVRYTFQEAIHNFVETDSYGYWHPMFNEFKEE